MIGVEISDKYTLSKNKTGGEGEILIIKNAKNLKKKLLQQTEKRKSIVKQQHSIVLLYVVEHNENKTGTVREKCSR